MNCNLKNYKTLLKAIEDDTNRWKGTTFSDRKTFSGTRAERVGPPVGDGVTDLL